MVAIFLFHLSWTIKMSFEERQKPISVAISTTFSFLETWHMIYTQSCETTSNSGGPTMLPS